MADEVRDVTSESSQEEQVVETPATDQQTDTEQTEQTEQTSETQEVKEEGIGDDRDVKNVAWEAKRKIDDLSQSLPEMIKSAMQEVGGSQAQPQEPKYTKAQLRAFAEQATDSSSKVWALEEIDKLEKTERQSEMKQLFDGYTQKTQAEQQRQQSTQFVAQTFPECFVEGPGGLQWDNNSPMTQRIGEYMRNKEIANSPRGLEVAAKMAAFDLGVSVNRKLQSKVKKTTAQLRKEQKKTLIAGGGAPVSKDDKGKIAKMAEEYRKTGDSNLFFQLAKKRGLLLSEE